MRNSFFIIAAAVFSTAVLDSGWAVESRVGLGTVRPGSVRSGLVRSPNPIDTSGNLVITGNVRGGRHFRGTVPYRTSSYFGAVTSSSSLDSFLRGSAGSEDFGRYTGTYKPFYSPSRTVTTTRPGRSRVVRPPTAKIGGHIGGFDAVSTLPSSSRKQALSYYDTTILGSRFKGLRFVGSQMQGNAVPGESREMGTYRPMSTASLEMERAILAEANAQIYWDRDRLQAHREMTGRDETWTRQFRAELERAGKEDTRLEKSLADEDEYLRPFELQRLRKQPIEDKQWSRERDREQGAELDVYEQMEQRINELRRSYEQLITAERAEGMPAVRKDVWRTKEAVDDEEEAGVGGSQGKGFVVDELSRFQIGRKTGTSEEQRSAFGVRSEGRTAGSELLGMDLSARAKAILRAHKSFASFSNDRFNQHLMVGEKHLKEGEYYRSAGAYTLASIYKPEEPLAYAGKSHALFAAGEYVSSALFISRAIIMESERCKTQDCEIGPFLALIAKRLAFIDRDKLEDRVADLEGWRQNSNSSELQFLLGYIYYQMGDLDAARGAIDGAYKKTPEEPAVVALREVIYNKKQSVRDKKL